METPTKTEQHTPGPWKFEGDGSITGPVSYDSEKRYTIVKSVDGNNWHANAKLMAAAPELLEALKRCAWKLEADDEREGLPASAQLERARDIIAAAEGR